MKSKVVNIKLDWKKIIVDGTSYDYVVEKTAADIASGERLITIYQGNNRYCEETTGNLRTVTKQMVKEIIKKHSEKYFSKTWPTIEGWYWIRYKGNKYGYVTCPAQLFIFSEQKVLASAKNDTFILSESHEPVDKSLEIGPRIPIP